MASGSAKIDVRQAESCCIKLLQGTLSRRHVLRESHLANTAALLFISLE
jgi:hypothetical protein